MKAKYLLQAMDRNALNAAIKAFKAEHPSFEFTTMNNTSLAIHFQAKSLVNFPVTEKPLLMAVLIDGALGTLVDTRDYSRNIVAENPVQFEFVVDLTHKRKALQHQDLMIILNSGLAWSVIEKTVRRYVVD